MGCGGDGWGYEWGYESGPMTMTMTAEVGRGDDVHGLHEQHESPSPFYPHQQTTLALSQSF